MLLQIGTVYADEGSANSMDITRQTSSNAEPKEIATTLASSTAGTITGLENGRSYYIMNLGTKKLLATCSAADTNGNTIVGRDRSELTNRQWELTVLGSSTGKLIWADSSTGKGVAISGESAILSAETETLTIQRINANNNYQGFYTIKYGGKYLSFYTDEDTPYYYIQLTTMLNQNSVWSFMERIKTLPIFLALHMPVMIHPQMTKTLRCFLILWDIIHGYGTILLLRMLMIVCRILQTFGFLGVMEIRGL